MTRPNPISQGPPSRATSTFAAVRFRWANPRAWTQATTRATSATTAKPARRSAGPVLVRCSRVSPAIISRAWYGWA